MSIIFLISMFVLLIVCVVVMLFLGGYCFVCIVLDRVDPLNLFNSKGVNEWLEEEKRGGF